MFRNRYRRNPTILIAIKRPHAPVVTMEVDLANYRNKIKEILGANMELHTYASLKDNSAILLAVDENSYYKIGLALNWVSETFGPIKGTAVFFKEGADGNLTSLNERDILRIKTDCGDVSSNPAKKGFGLYEDHEDVGKTAVILTEVVFGDGAVPAGVKGKIMRVEPAASCLVYIVDTGTHGTRGFTRNQITVMEPGLANFMKPTYKKSNKTTRFSEDKRRRQNPIMTRHQNCAHCNGQGLVFSGVCPICHGSGLTTKRHNPCVACVAPLLLRNPSDREQLENKYQALVIKKYDQGLTAEETEDMARTADALDQADAGFYKPIIDRLRDRLRKAGPQSPRARKLRRRNPDRDWSQFVPIADEPEMEYMADDEALPEVWKRY